MIGFESPSLFFVSIRPHILSGCCAKFHHDSEVDRLLVYSTAERPLIKIIWKRLEQINPIWMTIFATTLENFVTKFH
jgi:hypothetical protein